MAKRSDRLIDVKEVAVLTGFAVKTIRMSRGTAATLPRPIIRRPRFVRWSLIEVEVWISDTKRRATDEREGNSNVIPLSSATRAKQRAQVLLTLSAHQTSPADSLAADCPAETDSY